MIGVGTEPVIFEEGGGKNGKESMVWARRG